MSYDQQGVVNNVSNFWSLLTYGSEGFLKTFSQMISQLINESVNDKSVSSTAPAQPGPLVIMKYY